MQRRIDVQHRAISAGRGQLLSLVGARPSLPNLHYNLADRQIVGILAEDIKRDLALSDTQVGLLAGPAISFCYAILGVPMAFAADG